MLYHNPCELHGWASDLWLGWNFHFKFEMNVTNTLKSHNYDYIYSQMGTFTISVLLHAALNITLHKTRKRLFTKVHSDLNYLWGFECTFHETNVVNPNNDKLTMRNNKSNEKLISSFVSLQNPVIAWVPIEFHFQAQQQHPLHSSSFSQRIYGFCC